MTLTRDRIPEGWDDAAAAYDEIAFPTTSRYASDAVDMLGVAEGDLVLDVAAGSGAATFAALDRDAQVVATDFSPRMIERLRERLASSGAMGVETLVMDGQDLKFGDQTFDKALSVFGLIFFPDRHKGFSEMLRVLKSGGKAAITSWAAPERTFPISVWGSALREVMPGLPAPSEPPAVYSLQDPEAFQLEMAKAGFIDVEIVPVVHTFDAKSPEDFWSRWHAASPVFTTLLQTLADKVEEFREALIAKVADRAGSGEVRLESEALIAIGSKPSF